MRGKGRLTFIECLLRAGFMLVLLMSPGSLVRKEGRGSYFGAIRTEFRGYKNLDVKKSYTLIFSHL